MSVVYVMVVELQMARVIVMVTYSMTVEYVEGMAPHVLFMVVHYPLHVTSTLMLQKMMGLVFGKQTSVVYVEDLEPFTSVDVKISLQETVTVMEIS